MTEYQADRQQDIEKITRLISRVVTQGNNDMLLKPINLQEVEEAMNQMAPRKVPAPDGFPSNFFHHLWDLIKHEVWEIVEESRKSQGILKYFNTTFLFLFLKVEGSDTPRNFIPISLCNMIYKIISKVIASRLNPILPRLISIENLGFVEGR